jgi:hypothetical protein
METIQAIGGTEPMKIVVGGRAIFGNTDMRDKWDAYNLQGNPAFMVKTVNEIIVFPKYIDDEKLLKEVLIQIWDAPIEKIFKGMAHSLKLDEPVIIARRTLFWKLKELIELVTILHLKYVQKQDIKSLVEEWTQHIKDNNLDTSSVILWTIFNKSSTLNAKYFPEVQFVYLGYCPHVSDERIKILLKFPVDKLIDDVKKEAPELDLSILEFNNLGKMLLSHVDRMSVPSELSNCKKPVVSVDKSDNSQDYIKSFMIAWLELNDCFKPYLEEYEHYYVDTAKKMDTVSTELDSINSKLLAIVMQ